MIDKCIHPDCECLDYCEAADPHSKTPTIDWVERKSLAEEKLRTCHPDDRKHWRACLAEANDHIGIRR